MVLLHGLDTHRRPYEDTRVFIHCHSPLLVEHILARYGNGDGPSTVHNPHTLPVRVGRDGKYYPYHQDEPTYLRQLPLGFKRCLKCRKFDHWTRRDFPMGNIYNKVLIDLFFEALKIHKQNCKQPSRNREQLFPGSLVDNHDKVRILRMHYPLLHIDIM